MTIHLHLQNSVAAFVIIVTMLLDVLPSELLLSRDVPNLDFPSTVEEFTADIEAEFGFGASDPFNKFQEELEHDLAIPDFDDLDFDVDTPIVHDEFNDVAFDDWYNGLDRDGATVADEGKRRDRLPNLFPYALGDVFKANWYRQYLHPSVRDRIYQLSARDRFHEFRTYFRMPLAKVDDLVSTFLSNGWITHSHHCRDDARLYVKAQLLILGVLEVLGSHTPFRKLRAKLKFRPRSTANSFTTFWTRCTALRMNISSILAIRINSRQL